DQAVGEERCFRGRPVHPANLHASGESAASDHRKSKQRWAPAGWRTPPPSSLLPLAPRSSYSSAPQRHRNGITPTRYSRPASTLITVSQGTPRKGRTTSR